MNTPEAISIESLIAQEDVSRSQLGTSILCTAISFGTLAMGVIGEIANPGNQLGHMITLGGIAVGVTGIGVFSYSALIDLSKLTSTTTARLMLEHLNNSNLKT